MSNSATLVSTDAPIKYGKFNGVQEVLDFIERQSPVDLSLKEINTTFFVRTALDDNRALLLGELYSNGQSLKPIVVTKTSRELVDGRHRKEGRELAGLATIPTVFIPDMDRVTLMAVAMALNTGGSLPPSRHDIEHTVEQMLESGATVRQIQELLPFPKGMLRKYLETVRSRVARAKLLRAVRSITDDGATIAEAASQHGVDEDKLKDEVAGTKRKHRKSNAVGETKANLSRRYGSFNKGNAEVFKGVFTAFEDGEISAKQARDVLEHVERLNRNTSRKLADWSKRLESRVEAAKG